MDNFVKLNLARAKFNFILIKFNFILIKFNSIFAKFNFIFAKFNFLLASFNFMSSRYKNMCEYKDKSYFNGNCLRPWKGRSGGEAHKKSFTLKCYISTYYKHYEGF